MHAIMVINEVPKLSGNITSKGVVYKCKHNMNHKGIMCIKQLKLQHGNYLCMYIWFDIK